MLQNSPLSRALSEFSSPGQSAGPAVSSHARGWVGWTWPRFQGEMGWGLSSAFAFLRTQWDSVSGTWYCHSEWLLTVAPLPSERNLTRRRARRPSSGVPAYLAVRDEILLGPQEQASGKHTQKQWSLPGPQVHGRQETSGLHLHPTLCPCHLVTLRLC